MISDRDRLKQLLVLCSLKKNRVVLTSGIASDYFIEIPAVTMFSEGAQLVGRVFLNKFKECGLVVNAAGGSDTSVSVSIAIASMDLPEDQRMDAFLIRRRNGKLLADGYKARRPVVLVEGVTTSGLSMVEMFKWATELKYQVKAIVSLVDREEGAMGKIMPLCPFYRIFTSQEIIDSVTPEYNSTARVS